MCLFCTNCGRCPLGDQMRKEDDSTLPSVHCPECGQNLPRGESRCPYCGSLAFAPPGVSIKHFSGDSE